MGANKVLRVPALRLFTLTTLYFFTITCGQSSGHSAHAAHHGGPGGGGHGPDGHGPDGGQGTGRLGGFGDPPPTCSVQDSNNAIEVSSNYIKCSELEYSDFLTLVQADVGLLQQAALCFAMEADNIEQQALGKDDVVEVDLGDIYKDCISNVAKADDYVSAAATADFLEKLVGPDSKACSCLPAYMSSMPLCGQWERFHHFGLQVEDICLAVGKDDGFLRTQSPVEGRLSVAEEGKVEGGADAGTGGADGVDDQQSLQEDEDQKQEVPPNQGKSAADNDHKGDRENEEPGADMGPRDHGPGHTPSMPDPRPPCPPGQEPHGSDASKCQSAGSQPGAHGERMDGRGPPPPEQEGGFSTFASIAGVVVIGGFVGIGGSWLWTKFQTSTRQLGIWHMPTGVQNDIGTELGPFGREYP